MTGHDVHLHWRGNFGLALAISAHFLPLLGYSRGAPSRASRSSAPTHPRGSAPRLRALRPNLDSLRSGTRSAPPYAGGTAPTSASAWASRLAAQRLAPSRLASAAAERVVEVLQEEERLGEREEEIGELQDAI